MTAIPPMDLPATALAQGPRDTTPTRDTSALEQTARDFEAAFLAEALSHMGLDRTKGVQGAAPFGSFVNRAYAEQLVERGGLGLAENIVRSLAAQNDPE